jgi:hypothetical protein
MPLLSFSVLKEKLLDGSKTQTIRVPRKKPLRVGDKLYIWWKSRTKQKEKLGEGVIVAIYHKCIADMTESDAVHDGFAQGRGLSAKGHLATTLWRMHPKTDTTSMFDVIKWKWTNGPLTNSSKEMEKSK